MTRHLLIMVAALFLGVVVADAQTFEFQYHGERVADGGTVTIAAVEDDYGFGELCCATNPVSDPTNGLVLKLLSGTTASGNATLTILENTLNAARLQWCMGEECVLMTNRTTLDKRLSVKNGMAQVQFDAENIRSEGSLVAMLSATIGGETHTVKIQFTNAVQTTIKNVSIAIADATNASSLIVGYYSVDGKRLNAPARGINIVRMADGTAKKLFIPVKDL